MKFDFFMFSYLQSLHQSIGQFYRLVGAIYFFLKAKLLLCGLLKSCCQRLQITIQLLRRTHCLNWTQHLETSKKWFSDGLQWSKVIKHSGICRFKKWLNDNEDLNKNRYREELSN